MENFDYWQSLAFGVINKLPETSSIRSEQIKLAFSFVPGIPTSVTNAFVLLTNPTFRRFCSNVSVNFHNSVEQFKIDGDVKQVIIRFVSSVMDLQPGSPENENLQRVARVLEQDVPKAQKKEELLTLTMQVIANPNFVPSYAALSEQHRHLADMALRSILTSLFNTLMPEDQAVLGAESDQVQAVAGGGASEEVEAVEPQQPPMHEGGFLQKLGHAVMDGGSKLAKVGAAVAKNVAGNLPPVESFVKIVQPLLPSILQNGVAAFGQRIPFLSNAIPYVLTLCNIGGDVHIGLGLYQHASLNHLVVFWTLEQGVMKGCFIDFTHDIHTHILSTFEMPQANDLDRQEPHLRRLMDQSFACEESSATRFHLVANVHYLFHHEVSCFANAIFECLSS